ncbi:MAG TPA: FkbM family methyltransferase [Stellaceae bacterium]|nr:FkbM family methyltransferase [Stellaceae bacterium]
MASCAVMDAGAEIQSFSQHGQDRFVYETFFKSRTEPGVFVDIGAYDGTLYSNTLLFEKLGWTGLCVEPLPPAFEKLEANRSAICINCAVGDRTGHAPFVEVEMPGPYELMYSGLKANLDEHHARLIREHGHNQKTYDVVVRPLNDILLEHTIQRIDYLSLDTEGSEWRILRDFDLATFDVKVISVENNSRDTKLQRHLAQRGYRLIRTFGGFDDLFAR